MLGSPTSFNDLGHFALNWLQWSTGRECCCWQGIQKSYSEEDDDDDEEEEEEDDDDHDDDDEDEDEDPITTRCTTLHSVMTN